MLDTLTTPVETDEPVPPTFQVALKEFVMLEKRRRDLEGELETVKTAATKVQGALLDMFADTGIQNAKCDGLTVYVRTDRFVSRRKEVESIAVCNALKAIGRGDMVNPDYNAASLKSLVLEFLTSEQPVPPELESLLNIGSVPRIATRKA